MVDGEKKSEKKTTVVRLGDLVMGEDDHDL